MTTETTQLDMNANRLKTTERKIEWLKNEIKDLEYVLSDDCINRNLKLCMLQMYREHLGMLENSQNKIEGQESLIKEMREAAKRIGYTWQDYDAGEDAWEDTHTGKWVKISDWISNSVESNPATDFRGIL